MTQIRLAAHERSFTAPTNQMRFSTRINILHLQLALTILLSLFFLPTCSRATTVEGIVLTGVGPLANAQIQAFPDIGSLLNGRDGFVSRTNKDKPGQFTLDIPAGAYFFIAHGSQDDQDFFSYHGLNPITISDEYLWLPFFAVQSKPASCEEGPPGISGRVTSRGTPLDRGNVSVYSLQEGGDFRGMGLLTNSLSPGGRFRFDLEPGSYIIVARKRQENGALGPLKKGDLFCYPRANPIELADGQSCEIEVACYPRDDIDSFLGNSDSDPRGRREEIRRAASLREASIQNTTTGPSASKQRQTKLSGRVLDLEGAPRPGLFVSAYPAELFPLFQMFVIRQITQHMAQTGQDGRYQLWLPPGSYYLVAREKIGEAPDHLEYYGLYEGNTNHSVSVEGYSETGPVDILVEQIMP